MQNKNRDLMIDMLETVPRNEWDDALFRRPDLKASDLSEINDALTARAVLLCELAEYLGVRGGFGCGDSGHDEAMKAAQKEKKKIRKAIGYSYP